MLDAIQKKTGGELSIRLNLGGTIPISATNITQAVADNIVQMGDDTFFLGSVPEGGVVRLPLFLRTRAEFEKGWDIEEKYLRDAYAKKNITLRGRDRKRVAQGKRVSVRVELGVSCIITKTN